MGKLLDDLTNALGIQEAVTKDCKELGAFFTNKRADLQKFVENLAYIEGYCRKLKISIEHLIKDSTEKSLQKLSYRLSEVKTHSLDLLNKLENEHPPKYAENMEQLINNITMPLNPPGNENLDAYDNFKNFTKSGIEALNSLDSKSINILSTCTVCHDSLYKTLECLRKVMDIFRSSGQICSNSDVKHLLDQTNGYEKCMTNLLENLGHVLEYLRFKFNKQPYTGNESLEDLLNNFVKLLYELKKLNSVFLKCFSEKILIRSKFNVLGPETLKKFPKYAKLWTDAVSSAYDRLKHFKKSSFRFFK